MRKPKTARLQKKKGFKREVTLQEAFDVIAKEVLKRQTEHCTFVGHHYEGQYDDTKLKLYAIVGREEETIVTSSKTIKELGMELERDVQIGEIK
ncbi:hypothetical protein ACQP3R_08330 [Bacillus inaquosorum]|uniref:hypothetical protein n=1 Tax=Bacillus inaquosorum TaxID=483913 RepID=UPI003CFC3B94